MKASIFVVPRQLNHGIALRFCWLSLLLFALTATAQISPGELSKSHQSLEGISNCTRCHDLGDEIANTKCLACHTPLLKQVIEGKGYHGTSDVKAMFCKQCHSEHAGRTFELIHWKDGQTNFAHESTGFTLEGAHGKLDCRACHKPDLITDSGLKSEKSVNLSRTFLGLSTACIQCHENEHQGQLSEDCRSCHSQSAWKPASGYTHDTSQYPLTGKHKQVDCIKCHMEIPKTTLASGKVIKKERAEVYAKYHDLSFTNCTPCHTDPHEGKFGGSCANCHSTSGFKSVSSDKFDHAKTHFPLTGLHQGVLCEKCHSSNRMTDALTFSACTSCHADAHKGQFASRGDKGACESCHTTAGFTPANYDLGQHAQSKYPLTGSHLAVPCITCHVSTVDGKGNRHTNFTFPDQSCKGCHKDIHNGQANTWVAKGGCEFCHTTESWHRVSFDHNQSEFKLVGKHATARCNACHKMDKSRADGPLVVLKPLDPACVQCHTNIHGSQFNDIGKSMTSADCQRCHTPEGWHQLKFDHNIQSSFKLEGAHAKARCSQCHKPGVDNPTLVLYKPLSSDCNSCHELRTQPKP